MTAMGFPSLWISRVMECIRSVSFSFVVNGHISSAISPRRGIRQGDPLSPYLFIICAEGLGILIRHAYEQNMLRGIRVSRGAPTITHLFFADDSIIFTRASVQEANTIGHILREYEVLSGQKVNLAKCKVSFSRRLDGGVRHSILRELGFVEVKMYGKYLGLPTIFDKSKRISFSAIRDRVWKKLQGWKEKLLTRAGKDVLIKAVVQAIPAYAMSYFKFPTGLCHDISSLIRRFWWGASKGRRGIHWKAWDQLCRSKAEGGLGFRNFENFNMAMLAKQ